MMYRLTTLGELAVHDCVTGRKRPVQRKALALLAALAVGARGTSRERLVGLLWPDSPEESARASLNQTIYEIRRALGNTDVIIGTTDLTLDPAVLGSDVTELEAAYSAGDWSRVTQLHRGPFLDGLHVRHSGEFERWADSRRVRYREMLHHALEQLAIESTEHGDLTGAVSRWRILAAEDPLASRGALGLMSALAAAGDRPAALAHYRLYETLLRQELDTQPDPVVVQAAARIRDHGPVQAPVDYATPAAAHGSTGKWDPRVNDDPALTASAAAAVDGSAVSAIPTKRPAPRLARSVGRVRQSRMAVILVAASMTAVMFAATNRDASSKERKLPVVVLPFANRTGDRDNDAVGYMIADWISQAVVRSHLAPVVEPSYGASPAGTPSIVGTYAVGYDAADVAGAGIAVAGRIYSSGDSLRFHALVRDLVTGRVLAAFGPVTHSRADPIPAISDVTDMVLGALARVYDRRLSDVLDSLQPPPRAAAYQHYIRGMIFHTRYMQSDSALTEFRRAYALDTTFVTARLWSVWPLNQAGRHAEARLLIDSLDSQRNSLSPIQRYGIDALRAGYAGDLEASIAATGRAAAMAPRSEWAWNHALFTLWANRPRDAIRLLEQQDPFHGWLRAKGRGYWNTLATAYHITGDFDGLWSALTSAPSDANVDLRTWEALTNAARGRYAEVERYATEQVKLDTVFVAYTIDVILTEMMTHNVIGRTGRGRMAVDSITGLYRSWLARRPKPIPDALRLTTASIYQEAGDLDAARGELSALVDRHPHDLKYVGPLAIVLARQGDSTGARALLAPFTESPPYLFKPRWESVSIWRAQVEGWLGNREHATALLSEAFRSGVRRTDGGHTWAFAFPRVRGYPPFDALVRSR